MLNLLLLTLGLAWLAGPRRPVARPGRVRRRHAAVRDRIPAPRRRGHQAVSRRAAGPVLRHHRHGAGSARGRCARPWVLAALVAADRLQVRADAAAGARSSAPARARPSRPPCRWPRPASSVSSSSTWRRTSNCCRRRCARWCWPRMLLSMLATPFLLTLGARMALRFGGSEWMLRALELHRIAARSMGNRAPRGDLRLRPQRPAPGQDAGTGGASATWRWTWTPTACAKRRWPDTPWSTATRRGAKRWSPPASRAPRRSS